MIVKLAKGLIPIFAFCIWVSGILLLNQSFPTETPAQSAGYAMLMIGWFVACVVSLIMVLVNFDIVK